MAVQAQYPSNILLQNRNGQDRKSMLGSDYSLQPQPFPFLDQSHINFNNGEGTNPRKRGREVVSLQSQPPPPTIVNLAQLHNQQFNVVSTGLRLAFEEQQKQNQSLVLPSSIQSSIVSEDVLSQIKHHSDEIDQLIQAQSDELRRKVAVKRQRHYHALLCAAEESVSRRLREKEVEIEKAVRRNAELEERVAQLRIEAHVWQSQARGQEATAASLKAQLQVAIMNCGALDKKEEGFRFTGGGESPAEDAESAYIDPERVESSGLVCKACRKGAVSVVVLPCRHLCLCAECGVAVDACPICLSLRSASVQVYLS